MSATLSYDLKKGLAVLTKEHRWDVLTVLILHANIRNRCWVSTDTICEMATNGNRNKAIAAKKWLAAHKTIEVVTFNKRVDEEKKLKPRQHVYQLLGKIQKCEDAFCDCQKLQTTVNYLYSESIDGETFKSIDGETFKSIDGETRSITNRSQPIEVDSTIVQASSVPHTQAKPATRNRAATKKKNEPKAWVCPENAYDFETKDVQMYGDLHPDVNALVVAWYADPMRSQLRNHLLFDARRTVATFMELERAGVHPPYYPALVKQTREANAWKLRNKGGKIFITDMQGEALSFLQAKEKPTTAKKPTTEAEYDLYMISQQRAG